MTSLYLFCPSDIPSQSTLKPHLKYTYRSDVIPLIVSPRDNFKYFHHILHSPSDRPNLILRPTYRTYSASAHCSPRGPESHTSTCRCRTPNLPLTPRSQQRIAEFMVSVPIPSIAKFAATEAPVPPEEPPGVRVRSYGLRTCPPRLDFEIPWNANSLRWFSD